MKQRNILLLLFMVALTLRVIHINSNSISWDEAQSIHGALEIYRTMNLQAGDRPHTIVYELLLGLWIRIFGISELAVRSMSLLSGSLSVILIFMLGKRLYSSDIGLGAAIILAFMPLHIKYSQIARTYSLLVFLSLVSTYTYISFIKGGQLWPYILSTTVMLHTHITAPLIVMAQGLHMITQKPIREWFLVQTTLFMLYVPTIYNIIQKLEAYNPNTDWWWIPGISVSSIAYTIKDFFGSNFLLLFFIIFIFFYEIKLLLKGQQEEKLFLLLILFSVPLVLLIAISLVICPVFVTKAVLAASWPLYIITAKAVKSNKLLILVILLSFLLSINYVNHDKGDWRQMIDDIGTQTDKKIYYMEGSKYPIAYYNQCFKENMSQCLETKNYFQKKDLECPVLGGSAYIIITKNRFDKLNCNFSDIVQYGELLLIK